MYRESQRSPNNNMSRSPRVDDDDDDGQQQQRHNDTDDDDNDDQDVKSNKSFVSTKESVRSEGTDEWRQYQQKLSEQLAVQKLREAVKLRERTQLEEAISECRGIESLQGSQRLQSAEVALEVLQANKELQEACNSKEPERIKAEMNRIRHCPVAHYLDVELHAAKYLLQSLVRTRRKPVVLDLDKNTISEMRRYQSPPRHIHRLMQAVWLLLGEDEDTTQDWRTVQRLSNPQGHSGLHQKLLKFDSSKVNVELAATASQILDSLDPDLQKVRTCAAAWTFYVWAKGMCEEVHERHDEQEQHGAEQHGAERQDSRGWKPANRQRQKEILGRLPQVVPRMDRVYYQSLVAQQNKHKSLQDKTQSSNWQTRHHTTNTDTAVAESRHPGEHDGDEEEEQEDY